MSAEPIDKVKGRRVLLLGGCFFIMVGMICWAILGADLGGALHDPIVIDVAWAVAGALSVNGGLRIVRARRKL